nr:leucine-rich repeat domain-containing protein [Providencia rettgeri]
KHLHTLNLRFNKLYSLPSSIGEIESLQYLDLRANQLSNLPDSLVNIPKLMKLDLRWNNFSIEPAIVKILRSRGCTVFI